MTMTTSAPFGATRRSVRVERAAAPPPKTHAARSAKPRALKGAAVFGLAAVLQITGAGPAAVAPKPAPIPPGDVIFHGPKPVQARLTPAPELITSLFKNAALTDPVLRIDPAPTIEQAPQETAPKPLSAFSPAIPLERPDEPMTFGGRTVPRWLVHTILRAAHVTGVDPIYLVTLADVESSLLPQAKASTSSAEGLFQFIDRTWLEVLAAHGADYGYGAAAAAITFEDGDPVIAREEDRAWIMGLKRDPYLSALMACELINDIQRELQADGERELTEAELYIAHFLGAGSAVRFLRALDEEPDASASKLFPKAAKANASLFTLRQGKRSRSVTVAEFYERIDSKIVRRLDRYDALSPLAYAPPQRPAPSLADAFPTQIRTP